MSKAFSTTLVRRARTSGCSPYRTASISLVDDVFLGSSESGASSRSSTSSFSITAHLVARPGYETVNVRVDLDAGTLVSRHTYPGIESTYVAEGGLELTVDGEGTRTIKAGDGFRIPMPVPHSVKNGDSATIAAVTYVVEKGKPLVARLRSAA